MSLDLTPRDYLEMLMDEHREYQEHWHAHHFRVSMRKAINCCALSNALPEIIFAQYGDTEREKVHGTKSSSAYREHLRKECEVHHTVRDICDFSKHGPNLDRRDNPKHPQRVSVQNAKLIRRIESFASGLLLVIPQHREVERLVVLHRDERTELLDDILEQVTTSWRAIFGQDKL
jgi:hypothetical protein